MLILEWMSQFDMSTRLFQNCLLLHREQQNREVVLFETQRILINLIRLFKTLFSQDQQSYILISLKQQPLLWPWISFMLCAQDHISQFFFQWNQLTGNIDLINNSAHYFQAHGLLLAWYAWYSDEEKMAFAIYEFLPKKDARLIFQIARLSNSIPLQQLKMTIDFQISILPEDSRAFYLSYIWKSLILLYGKRKGHKNSGKTCFRTFFLGTCCTESTTCLYKHLCPVEKMFLGGKEHRFEDKPCFQMIQLGQFFQDVMTFHLPKVYLLAKVETPYQSHPNPVQCFQHICQVLTGHPAFRAFIQETTLPEPKIILRKKQK
jgi:hypothetical protein